MSHSRMQDAFARALKEYNTTRRQVAEFNKKNNLTMKEFRVSNLREARALRTELDGRKQTMDQREVELRESYLREQQRDAG